MRPTRSRTMTENEINEVVSRLLRSRFADLGFERSTVESEEDFDGSSNLRVTAHFSRGPVSADRLIDASHDIRSELIRRGEERFVFLDSELPQDQGEFVDEDLE
jgi:hypothetical protein